MNIGDFKKAIRNACYNSPALTPDFIKILCKRVLSDICIKASAMKNYTDITCYEDTFVYVTNANVISIDKIDYGTADDFSDESTTPLMRGKHWEPRWVLGASNPRIFEIHTLFNPDSGNTMRVYYNSIEDFTANLTDANDAVTLDSLFSPIIHNTLINGCIAYYKNDFEDNPAALANYTESLNDIAAIYNERVENL